MTIFLALAALALFTGIIYRSTRTKELHAPKGYLKVLRNKPRSIRH